MDLAQLYENLPDAVYIVDSETSNIIGCNRAACTDLGYSREEVLGHSVLTLQRDVMGMAHWRKIVESARQSGSFVLSAIICVPTVTNCRSKSVSP